MSNSIYIRTATPADNEAIRTMIFSVLDEYNVAKEPHGDDLDATEFGLNPARHYLVADLNGRAIGSAILTETSAGVFKLSKLFLPKEHRGSGNGRMLLNGAVEHARALGASEVYLRTRDSYQEAIKLYDRCGWVRSDECMPPPGPPVKYTFNIS